MSTFTISGIIIRKANRQPVSGLYIEAWDKEKIQDHLLSSTITDQKGAFIMRFDEAYLSETFCNRLPEVYFKVFSKNKLLHSTENSLLVIPGPRPQQVVIEVDFADCPPVSTVPRQYIVKGTILEQDYRPAQRYRVTVLDKGIVNDVQLVVATTDDKGSFEVTFTGELLIQTGKASPDIFLTIASPDGNPVHETAVVFNAPTLVEFREVIGGAAFPVESEFEAVTKKLQPLTQSAAWGEIKRSAARNPFRLLAEKTGEPEQKIKWFVTAHQLAAETKLPAEFHYALLRGDLASEHNALLNKALTTNVHDFLKLLQEILNTGTTEHDLFSFNGATTNVITALVAQPDEAITGAVTHAIRNNIIPAHFQAQQPALLEEWKRFKDGFGNGRTDTLLSTTRPEELRRLARLSADDLKTRLPKETAVDRSEQDIRKIAATLETRFPTASFAGNLERDKKSHFESKASMLTFFEAFPNMELHKTNIDLFIQSKGKELGKDFDDVQKLRTDLKKAQRVFKLAPQYDKAKVLLDNHIHSAQAVYNLGEKRFMEKVVNGVISKEEAKKIYRKAERTYAATLALIGELKSLEHAAPVNVLPDVNESYKALEALKDMPDWKTLFTSPDICECEHCRSVYSPAAYLADLLKFLNKRGSTTPFVSAKEILFKRRPDIGEIDLNCENSETAIPYTDLVCEILEDALVSISTNVSAAVLPFLTEGTIHANVLNEFKAHQLDITAEAVVTAGALATEWFVRDNIYTYKVTTTGPQPNVKLLKQTHGSAAERKAMPEYINYMAYETILKDAKHPLSLPFDLSWEEVSAYLEKIEINRSVWMENFRNKTTGIPADAAIAAEYLGLSSGEKDIITTVDLPGQSQYWNGIATINNVAEFLHKSQLEYKQLEELLRLQFINPAFESKIVHTDTTCDTAAKTISNLNAARLDRINRFLRLWKKTGWKMWELDKVIMSPKIGNGSLNDNFLMHLQSFMQVRKELNISVEELLAYYEDMNMDTDKALYQKRFRNKVILDPLPDAFKVELVTESPFPNPAPADRTITAQLKSLAAVLKLKEEEATDIQSRSLTTDDLTISNISTFFRIASLIRKLKITAREFYLLLELLNTGSAFDVFQSPAKTKEFITLYRLIKSSRFSVYELMYLLLHREEGTRPFIPADDKIIAFIVKGRQALQQIKDELDAVAGLPDEIAKTLIGKFSFIDEAAANETIQVFNGTFTGNTVDRDLFLDSVYGPIINTATLKAELNDRDGAPANQKDEKTKEAYEELNKLLISYLQKASAEEAISQLHTSEFKLPPEIVTTILNKIQLLPGTALLDHWFDENLLAKDASGNYVNAINAVNFNNLFNSYQLINKIALLQTRLPFKEPVLSLLIDHTVDFNTTDYQQLPITSPVANSRFEQWKELVYLQQFSRLYPDNENGTMAATLAKLVPVAVAEADFLQAMADYTGWDLTELTALKTQLGLNYPADYKKTSTWLLLDTCFNLLTTPAIKVSQVALIINSLPSAGDALSIKQLVKSKYDNDQWVNTSANIQEIIREKKRDALIAYFTHHTVNGNDFENANALYAYYLLDVEMGAKEVTTRILQANLSIQLFIQRCLMNLEAEVIADESADDGWNECDWIMAFRVWEANRKVFLYPENWIEPELRLDKSYFFKELESDLMQNEINQQNVENAYLLYLEKLDNVARLDVCGYYYEHETYTLHVFARTYDDPNIYYYRKWVEDRYWTPWEKVDLEINATHVVPLVINRRLYLYWPDFREKALDSNSTPVPNPGQSSFEIDRPYKYWEIRMAVSEYRNKKWTPKKISKTFFQSQYYAPEIFPATNKFSFLPLDLLDTCDKYLIGCFLNTYDDSSIDPYSQYYYGYMLGFFELGGCHGTPEKLTDNNVLQLVNQPVIPQFERSELRFLESHENVAHPNDVLAFQQGNLFINHVPILHQTPGKFRTPLPAQLSFFDKVVVKFYWMYIQLLDQLNIDFSHEWSYPYPVGTMLPFFYEDKKRTFFVPQQIVLFKRNREEPDNPLQGEFSYTDIIRIIEEILRTGQLPDIVKPFFEDGQWPQIRYQVKFANFYHPYVCFMIKQLYKHGLDGMMKREVQLLDKTKFPEIKDFKFADVYQPTWVVNPNYPKEEIDFTPSGSYSGYNWELFFHGPLMIATRLSKNQRFEEAMHWFHYIFNPTDTSIHPSPNKFWITKPFFERSQQEYIDQRIDQILTMINSGNTELIKQVDDWRRNAFQPHLIAQFRTVAYQKTVVMKYLDNLIAWGDNLFRSDRREAINEATQLYILAAEILGPKPKVISKRLEAPILNYNQLEPKLDAFSNAMINVEDFIPYLEDDIHDIAPADPLPALETFYFCIPQNDKMLEYWDTIADRLFKIRHSMNIDGIERSLALFDPPIDPGLLVKAVASGISLGAAIAGLNAALPGYRFLVMIQKANELTAEVKSLGSALLSVLEKRDAEALALLRSTQEISLLKAVKAVREKQIEEAKENIGVLKKTKAVTEEKKKYYGSLSYMNAAEIVAFALSSASTLLDVGVAAGYILAGGLKAIPQFIAGGSGFGGSPHVTIDIGGKQFGDAAEIAVKTMSAIAGALDKGAALASTQGSYARRKEDWDFQKLLAEKELEQIDKQITAAEIRQALAEKELESHELQIENAKAADEFMRSKFTNQELYEWMIGQVAGIYFQSYQLAFDVAKKAERCYRYELGLEDSNFIQFGYWDSLKKGLLSGERLSLDIKRLETSWYDLNKREFEIVKHISLSQVDPVALIKLKQNGECFINLPEELFDLDYPGHYFRRIKSVAVTIPCIIGPYNNVNCTLTLLKSRIRVSPNPSHVNYSNPPAEDDPGFRFNFSSIQQIVTSSAQNDNGQFEINLRDERYLPFEGHGAISEWKLEINKDFKNFELETISEVIMHMRLTARQGGKLLAAKVKSELNNNFDQVIKTYENGTGFFKLFSMKSDFPTELHRLLHATATPQQVNLEIMAGHVPYWLSGRTLEIDDAEEVQVLLKAKRGETITVNTLTMQINGQSVDFTPPVNLGELKVGTTAQSGPFFGTWNINGGAGELDASKVDDILLLVKYKIV